MSVMWHKIEDIQEIPAGDWIVILEGGEKGYLKVRKGKNCTIYIVNGNFHFYQKNVIAYTLFPSYNADEIMVEKEEKVMC